MLGVLPAGLPGTEAGMVAASATAAAATAGAADLVKLLALGGPVPPAPVPTKGAAHNESTQMSSPIVFHSSGDLLRHEGAWAEPGCEVLSESACS